jgi:branched-chain amino acid transport system ATP-binding protein
MLLRVNDITVHYEKVAALGGVHLAAGEGEIVSLIGANGAGKSTCLRAICGLKRITEGEIWFNDQRIDKMRVHEVVKLGVSMVPEGRKLFSPLSVMKNLEMGGYCRNDKNGKKRTVAEIFGHFPVLKERLKQTAGSLSGGEQQMLAIGRALMSKPALLLLDEPSLGLAPLMVEEIARIVKAINDKGVCIVLVEQNAAMALSLSHRTYVLELGKVVLEGRSEEVISDQRVLEAYLGGKG